MLVNQFHLSSTLSMVPILKTCIGALGMPHRVVLLDTASGTFLFLAVEWVTLRSNYNWASLRLSYVEGEFNYVVEHVPRNPNSYGTKIICRGEFRVGQQDAYWEYLPKLHKLAPFVDTNTPKVSEEEVQRALLRLIKVDSLC